MNTEIFKSIPGYEGLYEVSNLGNVKSLRSGKIMKVFSNGEYLKIELRKDGKGKKHFIHRLVALTFLENNDPEKTIVNHKDENPLNNYVDNLEWCDYSYNLTYGGAQERRLRSRYHSTVAAPEEITFISTSSSEISYV